MSLSLSLVYQVHPNHEVYDKVIKILEVYFAASEEEAIQGIAPSRDDADGAFTFANAPNPNSGNDPNNGSGGSGFSF